MHTAPLHERKSGLRAKWVLFLVMGLFQTGSWLWDPFPCGAQSHLLPGNSEMAGWHMVDRPYHYGPKDLYEYIDGEADFFVGYGFVALVGATYEVSSDPEQFITADVYDMGEKLSAFGVYQAKRDDTLPSLGIGAASAGTGGYASFYKDRYYVEIVSVTKEEKWKHQHVLLAKKIVGRIEGDVSPPRELSFFPETGKIPGSERYVVGGILGHAFLHRGLVCSYEQDGEQASAFVALFDTSEEAARSQDQHKAFLHDLGQAVSPLTVGGVGGFASTEPYHKQIIEVRKGSFLIGLYGLSHVEKGKGLLLEMLDRIGPLTQR